LAVLEKRVSRAGLDFIVIIELLRR